MPNKLLNMLTKSLAAKIAWIGGATAGITAVLSAIGFLVIRAHHELLGITGLVPTQADSWTIEGARFVYNTLLLIFAGCLSRWSIFSCALIIIILLIVAANGAWLRRIHAFTKYSVVRGLMILLTLAGLYASIVLLVYDAETLDILVSPSSPAVEAAIASRSTSDGIKALKFDYAFQSLLVVGLFFWLKLLPLFFPPTSGPPAQEAPASRLTVWQGVLWFFFLILLILIPMKYGQLVKESNYYQVCLLTEPEPPQARNVSCEGYQGWLLHKDNEEIVLYQPSSPARPLQVFKQKQFPHIQVFTFGNILASGSSTGHTIPGMGSLLQNLPNTFATGILTFTRTLISLRTLVLATPEGDTLTSIEPFREEEAGSIQSPIWLCCDRILFVMVRNSVAVFKEVSVGMDAGGYNLSLQAEDFGLSEIEGWEPYLTPDGQFVIFRQGTAIMRANLTGEDVISLLDDREVEQLLGIFTGTGGTDFYLVFAQKNAPKQLAHIQNDDVRAIEPVSGEHWELLPHLRIHNNRILYEKQETIGDNIFWNIYVSQSSEQQGRRITNLKPGAASSNSRYPAWSPDGSTIVYASE